MIRSTSCLAALLGIALAGCGGSTSEPPASHETAATPSTTATPPAPPSAPLPVPAADVVASTRIVGFAFEDKNKNGVYDEGDVPLTSQTVLVTNPSATQRIKEVTTDAQGRFRFDDLADGEYRLSLQIPAGYNRTNDDSFSLKLSAKQPPFKAQFGVVHR
jgi:hypothetical protein